MKIILYSYPSFRISPIELSRLLAYPVLGLVCPIGYGGDVRSKSWRMVHRQVQKEWAGHDMEFWNWFFIFLFS